MLPRAPWDRRWRRLRHRTRCPLTRPASVRVLSPPVAVSVGRGVGRIFQHFRADIQKKNSVFGSVAAARPKPLYDTYMEALSSAKCVNEGVWWTSRRRLDELAVLWRGFAASFAILGTACAVAQNEFLIKGYDDSTRMNVLKGTNTLFSACTICSIVAHYWVQQLHLRVSRLPCLLEPHLFA